MKERRKYERFQLSVSARLRTINPEDKQVFDLWTRNISAGGAFLDTKETFPKGTKVRLELAVLSEKIEELTNAQSLIEAEGKVVRSNPKGVAVHFDKGCQIMSLKGL